MKDITISQISAIILFIVAFIGGVEYLLIQMKKWLKIALKDEFEPINNRLNNLEEQNKNLELSSDKNYLVHFLSCIEQNNVIDEVENERFYETYERYHKLGGNSYIDHKVEKLKKEGKL